VLFAEAGLQVHGYDINDNIIDKVSQGIPHFNEPDLDVLLKKNCQNGLFTASNTIIPSDAYIIAVPTPISSDKKPDLSYVVQAVESISDLLKPDDLVIIESTVPIGACDQMAHLIHNLRPDLRPAGVFDDQVNIHIAHCPERVLPGKIIHELIHNDRIIGGITRRCTQKAINLYQFAIKGNCHATYANIAETVKLTENAFRDVNIAFANELSMMCDKNSVNVRDVIYFANKHPRVNILSPGPGVGGHCIAVDPWFLIASDPENAKLMRTAREVNDAKPHHIVEKIIKTASRIKNPVIQCLGLTYKADVDDIRESPSLEIVKSLIDKKVGNLLVSDPLLTTLPKMLEAENVTFIDFEAGIKKADIIVLLTDHSVFKNVDRMQIMQKIVIDTRGLWT
ncbi:MAG: UDP-N-acetyl-D-mannosaminuronic acid dehydrogenase, partial [Alphaproteobacteria bacterium]